MLPPKGHLLVVGNKDADAGVGPGTDCVAGGPATCFYATWKVSASKGESIFLIGAGDEVEAEEHYPANAAPKGQTWCRLPDLAGAFAVCKATPGASNAAP
jgi:hypothetical protein